MLTNIGPMGFLLILLIFSPLIIGLLTMGGQKTVRVKHEASGLMKQGFYGYCWTYFFFGWLVPVFRGEIGIGMLHLLFSLITFGIFQLIMPFLYNKQYTSRLLTSGFGFSDTAEINDLARMRIGAA